MHKKAIFNAIALLKHFSPFSRSSTELLKKIFALDSDSLSREFFFRFSKITLDKAVASILIVSYNYGKTQKTFVILYLIRWIEWCCVLLQCSSSKRTYKVQTRKIDENWVLRRVKEMLCLWKKWKRASPNEITLFLFISHHNSFSYRSRWWWCSWWWRCKLFTNCNWIYNFNDLIRIPSDRCSLYFVLCLTL